MKSYFEFLNNKNSKINWYNSGKLSYTDRPYAYTNQYNILEQALGTPELKTGINHIDLLEILKRRKMGF